MKKYRGINVEHSGVTIRRLIELVTLKAFADGGEDTKGEAGDGEDTKDEPVNYEDLIAKARKEEKDKLYKEKKKLKEQIDTLTEQHNTDLLKIAALEKEKKAAEDKLTKAGAGDSEELKTLKAEVETLKSDKATLEKKVQDLEKNKPVSREEVEKEVRAELEKEFEVRTYKAEKMVELKDQILVPELVGGDTKEDVDKSIQAALERSKAIRKQLGLPEPDGDTSDDGKDKGGNPKPPAKRTPKTPANPKVGLGGGKEISLEYLASLDVGSKEYAEVRKQLGLR